jgi:hypothetical protein
MTTFVGNDALAILGEQWNQQIRTVAQSIGTPEAQMLASRLKAGLSGEVEDRLALAVLAGAVLDLRERVARLEAMQQQ